MSDISKERLEGLVAGCLDLYESYGYSLNLEPEEPFFSIPSGFSDEEKSEEEKEEERKQEELRQRELEEEKRKKEEKFNNFLTSGRKKKSYKYLESIEASDYKEKSRNSLASSRCWGEYGILDKLLKFVRNAIRNKQPNAGVFLDTKFPVLLAPTFSEMLVEFMRQKGLESKDVYIAANIDRRLFSKILSDTYYQPSRETAISLCLALHLTIEETEDFLSTAGYSLSKSKINDIVIEFFIRTENYDVVELQEVIDEIERLFKQGLNN